jgi:hypothetical protein
MFNPRYTALKVTNYALKAEPEVKEIEARLAELGTEIPAYQETIHGMASAVGLQSADACYSKALLEYLDQKLRPAVLLQTQRVAEQGRLQEELVKARAVMERPEYLTDLAAEMAVAKAQADAKEEEARDKRVKLDAEKMLCREAGIPFEELTPFNMRMQLTEYALDMLKRVAIDYDTEMTPSGPCEIGSFVEYTPQPSWGCRTPAMPWRLRARVLQRVTDTRFAIVYLSSCDHVRFDVVTADTLRRILTYEPDGKRARV